MAGLKVQLMNFNVMHNETFKERNEYGEEAVMKTLRLFRSRKLRAEHFILPERWKHVLRYSAEYHRLRYLDEKYGDIWLNVKDIKYRAEIKRGPIALQTIHNSKVHVFINWIASLETSRVFYPEDLKNLNENNAVRLLSGSLGFTYEQLNVIESISLSEWLKIILKI